MHRRIAAILAVSALALGSGAVTVGWLPAAPAYAQTTQAAASAAQQAPTPAPPPPAGACTATYELLVEWPGGFVAEVTVSNNSGSASTGWSVAWVYPDGQAILDVSGGVAEQAAEDTWVVRNDESNGTLPPYPDGSTSFGIFGTWDGVSNGEPEALTCTLT